jgi:phosphoribosyl-ATP pyrophosphohydrolase/phosphoribosyl-AMP cyclohydrolase
MHGKNIDFLVHLQDLIDSRRSEMPKDSYTTKLFSKGINKIAQKVGEEAIELIIEAKDNNPVLFLNESADLVYHLLVLLSARGHRIEEVVGILEQRHNQ